MIRPDVATTIVTATTDAIVEPAVLAELLRGAADASLNLVSVDGSESTNDTLVVLASGASGVTASGADAEELRRALTAALLDVARQMVADGEGASRFAHYTVTGAADDDEARTAVRAIGEDILVRCALHGADPELGPHARARGHLRRRARPRAHRRLGRADPARRRRRRGRRRARRGRRRTGRAARSRSASTWPRATGAPSCTRRRSRPNTWPSTRSTRRDADGGRQARRQRDARLRADRAR